MALTKSLDAVLYLSTIAYSASLAACNAAIRASSSATRIEIISFSSFVFEV